MATASRRSTSSIDTAGTFAPRISPSIEKLIRGSSITPLATAYFTSDDSTASRLFTVFTAQRARSIAANRFTWPIVSSSSRSSPKKGSR